MGVLNAGAMLACSLARSLGIGPPESGMEVFSCFVRGREGKRARVSPHRATPLNLRAAAAAERQNLFVSLPRPPPSPSPSEGAMNGLGLVLG